MNYQSYYSNTEQPITIHNAAPSQTRRGPWSPDEDRKLMELISIFGPSNWVRISSNLGTRTPKQCRERYHQNLKPSLNKSPITIEEGELIERLVGKYGKKWAEISRHLNGRSDNAIKNWWNGGANRRRKASLASNEYRRDLTTLLLQQMLSTSSESTQQGLLLQLPPQSQSSQQSTNTHQHLLVLLPPISSLVHLPPPHLPQIAFNTSMFNSEKEASAKTSPPSDLLHSPVKQKSSRSSSLDVTSQNVLPPIASTKRRLLDESLTSRRHSTSNSMYLQNNSSLLTRSHPNLSSTLSSTSNTPPYYGSPLTMSRNNSITHCDFHNSSGSSRRSSIAPDFFPNPLKDSSHKRTISQNSFNSTFLTPSNRFSISSGSGATPFNNILTTTTSPVTLNRNNTANIVLKEEQFHVDHRHNNNANNSATTNPNSIDSNSTVSSGNSTNTKTNEKINVNSNNSNMAGHGRKEVKISVSSLID
ncbi:uncharacterized protein PRCAT00004097001 [Priceomyces carsonii]|uniref:uncharacterized protein n=1 Tax=Priceomyces carsonii TaxID=28549 RepID=UPI002ED82DFF|nr:unnamed protein product [Priceomyces carsonii]